jgi:hypothetical protein
LLKEKGLSRPPTTTLSFHKRPVPWQRSCPYNHPLLFVIPERTRISYFTALTSATFVVLSKENHMQLTEATTLDRKSGEAEGSAVPRTLPGNVSVFLTCKEPFHFPNISR